MGTDPYSLFLDASRLLLLIIVPVSVVLILIEVLLHFLLSAIGARETTLPYAVRCLALLGGGLIFFSTVSAGIMQLAERAWK